MICGKINHSRGESSESRILVFANDAGGFMRSYLVFIAVAGFAGCAYDAAPITTGAVPVVASYTNKIPGKYALIVDAGELNKVIHPRGVACSAHSYPLNMSEGFRSSVRATFSNIVDQLEDVPSPLSPTTLRANGYRGQIIVRGESLEGKLIAIPGFWVPSISTTIQLSASIVVDGPEGRLLGRTVEGLAERESEAGTLCSGGAASVEEASSQALRKAMQQLGETLANADQLHRDPSKITRLR
jgi:hypothetical protein